MVEMMILNYFGHGSNDVRSSFVPNKYSGHVIEESKLLVTVSMFCQSNETCT